MPNPPKLLLLLFVCSSLLSCTVSRNHHLKPGDKIPGKLLVEDFRLFRNVLEESHPGLYWFTPKDSMDIFFEQAESKAAGGMTEPQFRNLMNSVITRFRDGHTAVLWSSRYRRHLDTTISTIFPLALKCWEDTAVIYATLNPGAIKLQPGTLLTSIDGHPIAEVIDSLLQFTNGDGYSMQGRLQHLSNRGAFGALYKEIYGMNDTLHIGYIDSTGVEKESFIPAFRPEKKPVDQKKEAAKRPKVAGYLYAPARMEIDSSLGSGYMTLNTFSRNRGLVKFFRKSFRELDKRDLKHLVIDLRANGGGDAGLSTLLTRYIINKPFRLADSLYCITRGTRYWKNTSWQPVYWFFTSIVTRKMADGKYHFRFFEKHIFKPRKKYHYDGNVYLLTGGNSFSATTLFAQKLKGQKNVLIIGEETGGGAYGNSAWILPKVNLPNTGMSIRVPRFRLVMEKELVPQGRGVLPDIPVAPTVMDIRLGIDIKTEVTRKLIEWRNSQANRPL